MILELNKNFISSLQNPIVSVLVSLLCVDVLDIKLLLIVMFQLDISVGSGLRKYRRDVGMLCNYGEIFWLFTERNFKEGCQVPARKMRTRS